MIAPVTRRRLLIGGGAGAGLLVAYALWPRSYAHNLRAAPGERLFGAYLKIGVDGRVVIAVPQAEMGQGAYTALPQILADELGADWRTVAAEPAPVNPLYANTLLAAEWREGPLIAERARREAWMLTGGSSSVRMFAEGLRDAGAAARVLLCRAAAARWDLRWEECDTADGFVTAAGKRLSFAELADAAAGLELPDPLPRRAGGTGRLVGRSLPRIDTPAKLDGSARFAGDVRVGGLVYASVRHGVAGNREAARRMPGVIALVERPGWIAAVATSWWAAERACATMGVRGRVRADPRVPESIFEDGDAERVHEVGDIDAVLAEGARFTATYAIGTAPHAGVETQTATARFTGDRLEVWAGTQAPAHARAAAARAGGVGEGAVTLYPALVGGGFGRAVEVAAIEQAVGIAGEVKRPVQLVWSRGEDLRNDPGRAPARARMTARVTGARVAGWHARIAASDAWAETEARIGGRARPDAEARAAAIAGAVPPYSFPALAVEHVAVDLPAPSGLYRGRSHVAAAFFTECFVDELARHAGAEPFSFRMGMLGGNGRFARVLSAAAALGVWDGGGAGSVQGLATHAMAGSIAAAVVEARIGTGGSIEVSRVSMVVDVGSVINPDLVRQQIEGGILWGIAGATGAAVPRSLAEAGLPLLADTPDMRIEVLPSLEPPGGAEEVAVPPIAPAIANAIFASTGQRLRQLPLRIGTA